LKDDATAIQDGIGLTVSDVVRMTLARIVKDKALPFEHTTPNAETRAAMAESRGKMADPPSPAACGTLLAPPANATSHRTDPY
jgi:addiction module RelB/DinJ family antitoxin